MIQRKRRPPYGREARQALLEGAQETRQKIREFREARDFCRWRSRDSDQEGIRLLEDGIAIERMIYAHFRDYMIKREQGARDKLLTDRLSN